MNSDHDKVNMYVNEFSVSVHDDNVELNCEW